MKKTFLILFGVLVIWALGYWVYLLTASDETRIRWLIDDMAHGFNASSSRATVSGLSEDFVDEATRARKVDIRAYLLTVFLRERDPKTKDFNYRLELGSPRITVSPEGDSGTVSVGAEVFRRRGEEWKSIWEVDIVANLRKEDGGWRVFRATRKTLSGKKPF